jgi:hypothetical protein
MIRPIWSAVSPAAAKAARAASAARLVVFSVSAAK